MVGPRWGVLLFVVPWRGPLGGVPCEEGREAPLTAFDFHPGNSLHLPVGKCAVEGPGPEEDGNAQNGQRKSSLQNTLTNPNKTGSKTGTGQLVEEKDRDGAVSGKSQENSFQCQGR